MYYYENMYVHVHVHVVYKYVYICNMYMYMHMDTNVTCLQPGLASTADKVDFFTVKDHRGN